MGTCISSIVAYSDFTSKSPDYVLGKAGLFSTKLSVPELCYFTSYTQSRHFLVVSLNLVDRNHVRVSACAHLGKRLRTKLRNLGILSAQRNLEIAQILRMRGTYMYSCRVII